MLKYAIVILLAIAINIAAVFLPDSMLQSPSQPQAQISAEVPTAFHLPQDHPEPPAGEALPVDMLYPMEDGTACECSAAL